MVYCGKPSKSCRQCRKRNIKCDKKNPSCGQCTRAHFSCPGYHNPHAVIFRHETPNIVHKAFNASYSITPGITIPLEERAKLMFISHHVFGTPNSNNPAPKLQYMSTFYPPSPNDTHFNTTLRAVSLAYFSTSQGVNSPAVLLKARKMYCTALALTNAALYSKPLAMRNITVLTVLLLGLFESITSTYSQEEGEIRHLSGALQLIKLRGLGQFEDPVSLSLFTHLSSVLLPDCLKRGIEAPSDFLILREESANFIDPNHLLWRMSGVVIRLCVLFAEMKRGLCRSTLKNKARELELEFDEITEAMKATGFLSEAAETRTAFQYSALSRELNFRLVRSRLDELLQQLS